MEISVQGPVVPGDNETSAPENIEIDRVDGVPSENCLVSSRAKITGMSETAISCADESLVRGFNSADTGLNVSGANRASSAATCVHTDRNLIPPMRHRIAHHVRGGLKRMTSRNGMLNVYTGPRATDYHRTPNSPFTTIVKRNDIRPVSIERVENYAYNQQ
jgi:hypothetical protein